MILRSANVVDVIDHVLKADTSVHLTEQLTGNRDFLHATLFDVLTGSYTAPADRPVVFSPFGLGVLDLVVGAFVHEHAVSADDAVTVDGFFHELDRHRSAGAS